MIGGPLFEKASVWDHVKLLFLMGFCNILEYTKLYGCNLGPDCSLFVIYLENLEIWFSFHTGILEVSDMKDERLLPTFDEQVDHFIS